VRKWDLSPFSAARRGFTLVELLVVVSVIAILAGLVLGALNAARQSAREAKTKATITKLHNIVMERYESYRTRRVPINIPPNTSLNEVARRNLIGVRDLMRMEMPQTPLDVTQGPLSSVARPALSHAFLARYNAQNPSEEYNMAEMFYMFVTMGDPEVREQFADNEVGDTDSDGWPEFVDGWGNPIMFLRWAPAFTDSDIQSGDPDTDHDPFDPRRYQRTAYRLVPLIYSAGPDGIYDITPASNNLGGYDMGNPYVGTVGAPADLPNRSKTTGQQPANGSLDHYDNIHNHRIEAR